MSWRAGTPTPARRATSSAIERKGCGLVWDVLLLLLKEVEAF
jgi:hypothetical protein